MNHLDHRLIMAISLTGLLVFFQNCSPESSLPLEDKKFIGPTSSIGVEIPADIGGNSIEALAINLLQNKCYVCHGPLNSIGVSQINDPKYLISIGQIIPGNPSGSPLFNTVSSGTMPVGSPLSSSEIKILNDWILAGAKTPNGDAVEAPPIIPLAGNFKSIQANIIAPKCLLCHSQPNPKDHVLLDSYAAVRKYVGSTQPKNTKLYEITASGEMPTKGYPDLNEAELNALKEWISSGALNN